MRPASLVLLILVLAAPSAAADEGCGFERHALAGAELETRDCDGARSIEASAQDPDGRTAVAWYDDERGRGLSVQRAPRLVVWEEADGECRILFSVAGEEEIDCVAGGPPAPVVPLP